MEYQKNEFCVDVKCKYLHEDGCGTVEEYCLKTAKTFHKWLKSNGYSIVKIHNKAVELDSGGKKTISLQSTGETTAAREAGVMQKKG